MTDFGAYDRPATRVIVVELAATTGIATADKQEEQRVLLDAIKTAVESIDDASPSVGQQPMASSISMAIASDQSAVPTSSADLGAKADAAASSDTGTFSLIALFKRLFSKIPAALGAQTSANSLSVVMASDQAAYPVTGRYPKGTATLSRVQPAADATLLAANASRISAVFQNVGTVDVYILPGSGTASATNGLKLEAGKSFTDDNSTGAWKVAPASGTGDVRVIEVA